MKSFLGSKLFILFALILIAGSVNAHAGAVNSSFFGVTVFLQSNNVTTWPSISVGTLGKTTGTSWGYLNPAYGVYNWTLLDKEVAEANSNGIKTLMYTFWVTPTWASSNQSQTCIVNAISGCAAPPSNIIYWDTFVTALVTRYKGKFSYYELWNEPNQPNQWSGNYTQMVVLSSNAYRIIKSIDPNANVISPGTSKGNTQGGFGVWLTNYFAAGGNQYADGVAWHGYICNTTVTGKGYPCYAPVAVGCMLAIDCAGQPLLTQVTTLEGIMATYGLSGKPLFDTEGGWAQEQNLPNMTQQAAYISRWYILQANAGVKTAVWWAWSGEPPTNPITYGALFYPNNGTLTQAGSAYQQTYKWLVGSSFGGPCLNVIVWSCQLTLSNGNSDLLVWSSNSVVNYYPALIYKKYQTLSGNSYVINGPVMVGVQPILLISNSSNSTSTTTLSTTTSTSTSTKSTTTSKTTTSSSSSRTTTSSTVSTVTTTIMCSFINYWTHFNRCHGRGPLFVPSNYSNRTAIQQQSNFYEMYYEGLVLVAVIILAVAYLFYLFKRKR